MEDRDLLNRTRIKKASSMELFNKQESIGERIREENRDREAPACQAISRTRTDSGLNRLLVAESNNAVFVDAVVVIDPKWSHVLIQVLKRTQHLGMWTVSNPRMRQCIA